MVQCTQNRCSPSGKNHGTVFVCDIADAMPQMPYPFFSLSKKLETTVRRYERGGSWLEVIPSVKGLATIYDKDILIYCVSQLTAKIQQGEPVDSQLMVNALDLLQFANRCTGGADYNALFEAVTRLAGTQIRTNIDVGDGMPEKRFGLIERAAIHRQRGRLSWIEVVLCDWTLEAIRRGQVLALHRDYFSLGKPLERSIYELARRRCERRRQWHVPLGELRETCGSQSPLKQFRQMIKCVVRQDPLPDYGVEFDEALDQVTFRRRKPVSNTHRELKEVGKEIRKSYPYSGVVQGADGQYCGEVRSLDRGASWIGLRYGPSYPSDRAQFTELAEAVSFVGRMPKEHIEVAQGAVQIFRDKNIPMEDFPGLN